MCLWVGPLGELFAFANAAEAGQAHGPWLHQPGWVIIAACGAAVRLIQLKKHSWQPLWVSSKLTHSNGVIQVGFGATAGRWGVTQGWDPGGCLAAHC